MSLNAAAAAISRRQFLKRASASGALMLVPGLAWARGPTLRVPRGAGSETADSVVLRWNNAALQGVRDSKLGPPMVARALAIVHTSVYDGAQAPVPEVPLSGAGSGPMSARMSARRRHTPPRLVSARPGSPAAWV
jgi:hypothetical protein